MTTKSTGESPILATHSTDPIRVTYRDTDRMGYTYYSQYLVWFEIGRTSLLRGLGRSYKDWEDIDGVFLPVRSCEIQYRTPARYDDLVIVETSIIKLTRASITLTYKITRADDREILAEGLTIHPFVDRDGKICRVGDRLLPKVYEKVSSI